MTRLLSHFVPPSPKPFGRAPAKRAAMAAMVVCVAALGGCASHKPRVARAPLLVPSASWSPRRSGRRYWTRRHWSRAVASAQRPESNNIFPLVGAANVYIPRSHKFAYSNLPTNESSYFSSFIIDAEPIGLPGGGVGYNYRYIYKQGSSGW